jgi:Na+-driven multidrug efflux pump
VLRLRGLVELKAEMLKPKKQIMLTLLKLGIPAGITQGIISLSFVFVQSFINAMGTLVAACCTAVMRVDSFAMIPNQTFSVSASTYTGQNVGAGDMDRVNRGAKTVLLMSLIASAVLVTFVLTCGGLLLSMFTDTESVIKMGIRMMRILGAGYIASAVSQSLSGVMRGAGDTMASMWITISTMVLVRIPLTWILARTSASEAWPHGNPDIIFVTLLVVFVLNMIVCVIYFKTGRWRTKAVVKRD